MNQTKQFLYYLNTDNFLPRFATSMRFNSYSRKFDGGGYVRYQRRDDDFVYIMERTETDFDITMIHQESCRTLYHGFLIEWMEANDTIIRFIDKPQPFESNKMEVCFYSCIDNS